MTSNGPFSAAVGQQQGGKQPHGHNQPNGNAGSPPTKQNLKSWWRGFKLPSKNHETNVAPTKTEPRPHGIFGVPLRQSITYANVAISLIDEHGKSYIYGYVPIVVAKCGVFLKEKATEVEGIFRLNGSEKRIKDLKTVFNSPDRYGKGLVWDGYTVHDAANVLRRYLNDLPEPVVPLDLYEKFRDPLRGATRQAVGDAEGPQFVENFDIGTAIARYQQLIKELPPLNRQLLLYLLDLLAVFAAKADHNRMNSQNLAAIFQPGILSHPSHDMSPEEYRLNQCVLIFLIENQDHFLIGMQGTAADAKTVAALQQGTPVHNAPSTPLPALKAGVTRSSSNASAGATSVAMEGQVRRNKSVSSRRSRRSNAAPSPSSPVPVTTPTSGLSRSNTVPSKRSPGMQSGCFASPRRDLGTSPVASLTPVTPGISTAQTPPVAEEVARRRDESAHALTPYASALPVDPTLAKNQERLLGPPTDTATPFRDRRLPNLFQRSPSADREGRQPNKLRKKRIPGSADASAHSSSASLPPSAAVSPGVEVPNPMDLGCGQPIPEEVYRPEEEQADSTSGPGHGASQVPMGSTLDERAEHTLRTKMSPPTSLHSSFNEASDMIQLEDTVSAGPGVEGSAKEDKTRWRLSRRKEDLTPTFHTAMPPVPPSPRTMNGANANVQGSSSSVGSAGAHKYVRQSFSAGEPFNPDVVLSDRSNRDVMDSGKEDAKGLAGWIKNKFRGDNDDKDDRRGRSKSPPRET